MQINSAFRQKKFRITDFLSIMRIRFVALLPHLRDFLQTFFSVSLPAFSTSMEMPPEERRGCYSNVINESNVAILSSTASTDGMSR